MKAYLKELKTYAVRIVPRKPAAVQGGAGLQFFGKADMADLREAVGNEDVASKLMRAAFGKALYETLKSVDVDPPPCSVINAKATALLSDAARHKQGMRPASKDDKDVWIWSLFKETRGSFSPMTLEELTKRDRSSKKVVIQDLMEKHMPKKMLAKIETWAGYCPAHDGLFTDKDVKRLARLARKASDQGDMKEGDAGADEVSAGGSAGGGSAGGGSSKSGRGEDAADDGEGSHSDATSEPSDPGASLSPGSVARQALHQEVHAAFKSRAKEEAAAPPPPPRAPGLCKPNKAAALSAGSKRPPAAQPARGSRDKRRAPGAAR